MLNFKMPVSRLDKVYRRILLTKFFTKGWGSPDNLKRLFKFKKLVSNRESCYELVSKDHPVTIMNEEVWSDCRIIEGKFKSPFALHVPEVMSPEVENAYFQVILPSKWNCADHKPMCIHLAGTGDHFFWRRRNLMAKPLIKENIGAILLENPFYGHRKPREQLRSSLHNVSDIFVMGGCLILECLVLLHWCENMGFGPLGVTGISMGGHMASLAATSWPKPLVLVPCLSWSSASSVFTEGVMSEAINWDLLQEQYVSDKEYYDHLSKHCRIVDDPFKCKLSHIPEYAFSLINKEEDKKYESLTPYEMLSMLNSAGANCPMLTCKESTRNTASILSSITTSKIVNLIRNPPFLFKANEADEMKRRDKEAVWFMKGIMDECTHLRNFSVPFNTSLIIAICANCDGYVPREGLSTLEEVWPGATVRYLNAGHVGAYLWHIKVFRKAVVDAFERAREISKKTS